MIFILFLFLIFVRPVMARNITCQHNLCDNYSLDEFYQAKNIYPGFFGQSDLKITNLENRDCRLSLKLSPQIQNNLDSQINLSIIGLGQVLYGGNLSNLHQDYHYLTTLKPKEKLNLIWQFSLDCNVDNLYQNLDYQSDIIFDFQCSNTLADTCNLTPPKSTPKNLKAIPGLNSVTLQWTEPEDVFTYHLIAYSQESHAATYANPNIGAPGTTNYTIYNLNSGTKYFFKIKVGNGCASGDFSEIVSATPFGEEKFLTPPSGFMNTKVLGLSTTPDYFPENQPVSDGKNCLPFIPFTFILALIVNLFFVKKPTFIFLLSLSALIVDYHLSRFTCKDTPYLIFTPLVSFMIPFFLSFKVRKI